ncbi:MAG: GlsB/YeaQ/YmgE family stress response membrane protein [Acidobacteria bacterium]|nr:GlsB/YeaQ/YmgE family stress response membrane protein [Acidobacteriota bacterium]MBV9147030.1 GlsB/YeaQ/YmgE family stress response membrane protein [Acidobacteriota bacterium]
MHLLWWIIVGLIAGWATGKIMRGSGFGPLMDIVVGIVGAIVGGWIMRALGFSGQGGTIYTILVAILGAVVLTWIVRLITGDRGTRASGGMKRVA